MEVGVGRLMSDKMDFRAKIITKVNDSGAIYQEDIVILNMEAPNNRAAK